MKNWIVIADASAARIFANRTPHGDLTLVRELRNPQGRMRTQELVTDSPGRVSKAGTPGTRSSTEPRTTAHQAAADDFARLIARILHEELERKAYDTLAVAAPPHLLGTLRSHLSKDVTERLRGTEAKDLAGVLIHDLRPHIQSLLQ